jgi:hypothetical protein
LALHPGVVRVPLEGDRALRIFGRVALVVAVLMAAVLAAAWPLPTAGAVLGGLLTLGLGALGARLAVRRANELQIDVSRRSVVVRQDGRDQPPRELDTLGPLEVFMREIRVRTNKGGRRTRYEFEVRAQGGDRLVLRSFGTPGRARRELERLARAWRLPAKSHGGEVRPAAHLDVPLHQRLRARATPPEQVQLPPGSRVRLEPRGHGFALVSSHRAPSFAILPAMQLLVTLAACAVILNVSRDITELAAWQGLFTAGLGLFAAGTAAARGFEVFEALSPGELRIEPQGVAYRWKRIAMKDLEEITWGLAIELVGDRKVVRLPPSFCPAGALPLVVREIERCVMAVGR